VVALAVVAALLGTGCAGGTGTGSRETDAEPPRSRLALSVRPTAAAPACRPGEVELRLAPGRRVLMRVTGPATGAPRSLLVALHGAGSGGAPGGLYAFRGAWDVRGLVIVAPAAAGSAWTLEPRDVRFVERALQRALARCRVDGRRIAIGGFSSGAGMALWLGLANGELFRGVIALSGGGSLPTGRIGKPRVFVAHGTRDGVIPIELDGDRIAKTLSADGYAVTYVRFPGGHRVRPSIARRAVVGTLGRVAAP
jgi:dipeptidyl aminopeptidase/acylaminoacyl peptidase